jgi:hypothetical protein
MSTVFTLQEVMENEGLGPSARAFCEALLKQGEVLAVKLSYLPDTVLWLVTTSSQAWLMRATQPKAVVLTFGEATELATSLGDPPPASLWQVAVQFSAPAPDSLPDSLEDPPDGSDDVADHPWD